MSDIRTLEVVTAAASQALTTLSTVKRALIITGTDSDTFLQEAIARASATIASECNRVFGQETVRERIWLGNCRDVINLRRYPNLNIQELTVGAETLDPDDDCLVDDNSGQIRRLSDGSPCDWPSCTWIEIEYQAGYALLGGLPYDIEKACIYLVKMEYSAKGRDPALKVDEVEGMGRQEFWVGSTGKVPDEIQRLSFYRNIAV